MENDGGKSGGGCDVPAREGGGIWNVGGGWVMRSEGGGPVGKDFILIWTAAILNDEGTQVRTVHEISSYIYRKKLLRKK